MLFTVRRHLLHLGVIAGFATALCFSLPTANAQSGLGDLPLSPQELREAGLETAMQALLDGDYQKALEEAGPLAEQGNATAKTIVALVELRMYSEQQHQKALAATGPIDLTALDGRYRPSRTEAENARLAEARRLYAAQDYEQAFPIWLALADAGDAEAQYFVSRLYFRGAGVQEDKVKSDRYLKMSIEQGFPVALEEDVNYWVFALPPLPSKGVDDVTFRYAFHSAMRSATNGGEIGMLFLSTLYCLPSAPNRNPVLADVWLFMATKSKEEFYEHACNENATPFHSYYEAIGERAEAMRKAYDIPLSR